MQCIPEPVQEPGDWDMDVGEQFPHVENANMEFSFAMNSWAVQEVTIRMMAPGFATSKIMCLQQCSVEKCDEICWPIATQ